MEAKCGRHARGRPHVLAPSNLVEIYGAEDLLIAMRAVISQIVRANLEPALLPSEIQNISHRRRARLFVQVARKLSPLPPDPLNALLNSGVIRWRWDPGNLPKLGRVGRPRRRLRAHVCAQEGPFPRCIWGMVLFIKRLLRTNTDRISSASPATRMPSYAAARTFANVSVRECRKQA